MKRRSFLKSLGAGTVLLADSRLWARVLYVIGTSESAPICSLEWILYDPGQGQEGDESRYRCALRITTTNGVQGWADVAGWMAPDDRTAGLINDLLLGRSSTAPNEIWQELYAQGLPLGTLGAVDIALWDLYGRVSNKSVHALIGTQRQRVKSYLTTDFNLGEPQEYADLALACKEKGVHGCKVHPYIKWETATGGRAHTGFPDKDAAVYQAVRDAVGFDYPCMADNYGTYTFDEAVRVGRFLDGLAYAWYESPMPESDDWLDRYATLTSELKTPVCAPENNPGSYPARAAWIQAQACNIGRIDVTYGGFTACLELARTCEAAGIPLELHNTGLDTYPHLQLIGATRDSLIPHCEIFSLSQDASAHPGRMTPEPVFDEQGYVAIPQTPGMGLELDWRYIEAHRVH